MMFSMCHFFCWVTFGCWATTITSIKMMLNPVTMFYHDGFLDFHLPSGHHCQCLSSSHLETQSIKNGTLSLFIQLRAALLQRIYGIMSEIVILISPWTTFTKRKLILSLHFGCFPQHGHIAIICQWHQKKYETKLILIKWDIDWWHNFPIRRYFCSYPHWSYYCYCPIWFCQHSHKWPIHLFQLKLSL